MAKESIRKLLQLGLSCTDLEALCCSVVRGSAAIHRISQMAKSRTPSGRRGL